MLGMRERRMEALQERNPQWLPLTIWQRFLACEKENPDADFIVMSDGERLTYRQARDESNRLADALWSVGVRRGDVVAFKMGGGLRLVCSMLALAKIGAAKAGIGVGAGAYETSYVIESAGASVLLCDGIVQFPDGHYPACLRLQIASEGLHEFSDGEMSWDDFVALGDLRPGIAVEADDPDAVSDILFTSGSTGNPKGAMLCHDQLLRSAFANCLNRGFEPGRRVLSLVPLNHCFGYVEGLLAVLFVGGALIMVKGKATPRVIAHLIEKERVADILSVPHTLHKFAEYLGESIGAHDVSSLHAVYCAGEKCPEFLWGLLMERLGVADIVDGYGMTETCGATMQTVPGDGVEVLKSKVGRLLPAGSAGSRSAGGLLAEYKVVNQDTGLLCHAGEVGRLFCRGVAVMKGYCNTTDQPIDDQGWLDTGDIGCFDSQGYLSLLGRANDVYRINGENVSPQFVECVLERSRDVERAVVVDVPDEGLGAVGFAFVQIRESTDSLKAVEAFCHENLARYQIPRYCAIVAEDEWPLTASGKVKRAALRDEARRRVVMGPSKGGYKVFAMHEDRGCPLASRVEDVEECKVR